MTSVLLVLLWTVWIGIVAAAVNIALEAYWNRKAP